MDAAQRIAYLDAMGVPLWKPRLGEDNNAGEKLLMAPRWGDVQILPTFQVAATQQAHIFHIDENHAEVTPSASLVEQTIDIPFTANPSPSESSVDTEFDAEINDADPDVQFTAIVKYHPSGVALVDVCEHALGHQRAHHELCEAMLLALCGHGQLSCNEFVWPVVNMPRMDRRRSKARASTKAFLTAFGQRHDIKTLICLGDKLHNVDVDHPALTTLAFSITDLLQGHISKREAWQQLRGLSRA